MNKDIFADFEDDFLKFEYVKNKLHHRPDIHAFLLLDRLVPGEGDMVSGAEHDVIYLRTDPSALASVASQDDLRNLHRCGVMYHEKVDSLAMFV